ncbi:ABC transporter ATP-binding protein/permease [Methylococcus sp. EFPC2]|uniref:ABC transporter ATP-binding protein/permease n=1 Tax=Methylococcus sp. EFPC2 TaxID=2812648 RepID=UPI0019681BE3|nr:ABC transporter ATP-binding protein/permease [Methylococcus sp. EFPC2]QSA97759.1 ABC transporter ATP-binding protein/permease [Methylococcus sp. EFPC2]
MAPSSPQDHSAANKASFRKTCRQLWIISKAFFKSERRHRAFRFFFALLALALCVGGAQVVMSYVARDFMTAIARKDVPAYWFSLWRYLGTLALAVPLGVYYRWTEERLAVLWREWTAQHLIRRYFYNRAYYRLRGLASIDNPDQRISEDVRNFTLDSLAFLLILLNATVTVVVFIGVLWAISLTLVGVLLVYAVAGTGLSILIGRRLVGLSYRQYQKEADFRYSLVRVRDNAESIAFYRGEKRERRDLVSRLGAAVLNMLTIIGWNRNLAFFVNTYNYAALVLPVVIVAPLFMRGEVEFGVVTQSAGAFAQVLAAVSLIITQFGRLSAYVAVVQRLGMLWDELDEFDAEEARVALNGSQEVDDESRRVNLEKVIVRTPDGSKTLVNDLTFELRRNQSLLIMGASGTGKSSVLRTIAGLWPIGSGALERPPLREIMFLPQRPYMIDGNLRDQLRYPYPDEDVSDEQILEVAGKVNLADVLDRVDSDLDRVMDWINVLSIGEQQRVAFARLFLRKPRFAFLDEATSALDEDNQARLYQLLKESHIGFISVGHRTTLIEYHDRVLKLDRSGSWEIAERTQPQQIKPAAAEVDNSAAGPLFEKLFGRARP